MNLLEVRPEVAMFALAMEARLRENDHKPGWKHDPAIALLKRLREELAELTAEVVAGSTDGMLPGEVLKEACDVANFSLMIADVCGGLEGKP